MYNIKIEAVQDTGVMEYHFKRVIYEGQAAVH